MCERTKTSSWSLGLASGEVGSVGDVGFKLWFVSPPEVWPVEAEAAAPDVEAFGPDGPTPAVCAV